MSKRQSSHRDKKKLVDKVNTKTIYKRNYSFKIPEYFTAQCF